MDSSFELSIYQRILKKCVSFHMKVAQLFSTLDHQIIERFLKDHVTLKTGVMMLLHHRNKLHFKNTLK